ncbi:hypothetical protein ES332_A12G138900v1 [Gossypium tomentosum]|uniref:Uncharacterized protein n=1 Tax=Gossypium tomentosum TaxID=34277 RepID=A0A5D2MXP9_GOSTO|nr:hypothetical protein ES332_A12G138900v1 [Gossypium tomentosum]
MMRIMRRHGWQRPLHPLQMVGMAVFSFLVVAFYTFLGLLLGNRIAEITTTTVFSFVAFSVIFLFVRCTAIDPTDKTSFKKKIKGKSKGILKPNYGFILTQIVVRFFRRLEKKILRTFIRRKYLDPWKTNFQMEPLLPFPLVMKNDAVSPDVKEDDNISYCSLCDFEGMGTYDYILAMKEKNQFTVDLFYDSDVSSDDSSDFDSPEKATFLSRFICKGLRTQVQNSLVEANRSILGACDPILRANALL